jgi:hypothetical protein
MVDIRTVDALARVQLTARRLGWELRLRCPPRELVELIDLAGLTDVLRVEPVRKPEQREQPVDIEERVQRGDPPA